MAKLPYMPLYVADYLRDTRCLSLATRGAWMDMMCALWNAPKRGRRTLTMEGWAGEVGKPSSEVSLAIIDLERNNVGKIIRKINAENIEEITIMSMRMLRDEEARKRKAKQKQYQRDKAMSPLVSPPCPQDVEAMSPGYIRSQSQKSESEEELREENTPPPPTRRAGAGKVSFPQDWKPDPEEMQQWKQHGINPYVEFATFRDHALANDRRCKDWKAAFRNWCRKAISLKEQKSWPVPGAGSIRVSA